MITLPWWLLIVLLVVIIYLTMWITIGVGVWTDKRDVIRKQGGDPGKVYPFNYRLLLGPEIYWNWIIARLLAETAEVKARTAALIAERERLNGG